MRSKSALQPPDQEDKTTSKGTITLIEHRQNRANHIIRVKHSDSNASMPNWLEESDCGIFFPIDTPVDSLVAIHLAPLIYNQRIPGYPGGFRVPTPVVS